MRQYIIAPTYMSFKDYCNRNDIPLNGSAVYVSSPHALRGTRLNAGQLHFVAGWRSMRNARDIEVAAHNATSRAITAMSGGYKL